MALSKNSSLGFPAKIIEKDEEYELRFPIRISKMLNKYYGGINGKKFKFKVL